MLINFVDATNDANHYTKPPPQWYSALWYMSCNWALLDDKRPQTSWTRSQCLCAAWFCEEVLEARECRHASSN